MTRPWYVVSSATILTIIVSGIVAVTVLDFDDWAGLAFISGVATLFGFGYLMAYLTRPLANQVARSFATMQLLSELVMALNFEKIRNKHETIGRDDAWIVLREIIVEVFGVDHDEVVPSANFVRDLGCD